MGKEEKRGSFLNFLLFVLQREDYHLESKVGVGSIQALKRKTFDSLIDIIYHFV